ncbi:MAG: protein translocase subunit secF/protein translocase subunit secD [Candidatus Berkelbacteria bacterium Gr01-1014_85]|uniref:Protein-export membrane protein SecF n=1 Tax=Candidatus Berkelbacteria bacterium Gr01-1014_85 TaxID=2017150 RepID=A0A554JBY3_9BACT|nr:MAG: protein translocase subunit secF/protein translocase subunit secD [Candidatus Berkelbacteria bacterium Gr01-1014_85]
MTKFRFLGPRKRLWLGLSIVLTVLALATVIIIRPKLGIEFAGGSELIIVRTGDKTESTEAEIKQLFSQLKLEVIQNLALEGNQRLVRTVSLNQEQTQALNQAIKPTGLEIVQFTQIEPSISREIKQRSLLSLLAASLAIVAYIAYSFRRLPQGLSSWRFGITAIVALAHDVLITYAAYLWLGQYFNFQLDSLLITALLTVMGFSVHDTIVVYDRIRERISHQPRLLENDQFELLAEQALQETLARSLATSLVVIIVLIALVIFGHLAIRSFVVALLIGITIGTYSSIALAAPLLVVWQRAKRVRL